VFLVIISNLVGKICNFEIYDLKQFRTERYIQLNRDWILEYIALIILSIFFLLLFILISNIIILHVLPKKKHNVQTYKKNYSKDLLSL